MPLKSLSLYIYIFRGDQNEGRKRFSHNSRTWTRRHSHESPLSARSSANMVDSAQLAALEREVMSHCARIANSAAVVGGNPTTNSSHHGTGATASATVGTTITTTSTMTTAAATNGHHAASGPHGNGSVPAGVDGKGAGVATANNYSAVAGETVAAGGNGNGNGTGGVSNTNNNGPAPADHPAPLRRASAGVSSGTAWGGVSVGGVTRQHITTSARIAPGIQALIAAHGAAAIGGGDAAPLPSSRSSSVVGKNSKDETTGDVPLPAAFASATAILAARAGGGGGRTASTGGGAISKAHRSQHRADAAGMRRAVREHKEALRKAAAAAAAAVAAAEGAGGAVEVRGESGRNGGGLVRRKVSPDPKGKVSKLFLRHVF